MWYRARVTVAGQGHVLLGGFGSHGGGGGMRTWYAGVATTETVYSKIVYRVSDSWYRSNALRWCTVKEIRDSREWSLRRFEIVEAVGGRGE